MKYRRLSRHVSYAIVSLACPVVALSGALAYQSIAHADFWRSITPDESAAGAMMAFGEVVQLILFLIAGCFLGLIFAVMSVRLQRRILGIGLAALAFNGLPFLLLISLWIKGVTSGL